MKKTTIYFIYSLIFFANINFAQTVPGTLATSATVCANNNSGILSLTSYTGNVVRWEYSLNGASLWTTIANTSATYNYVNLPQTTYFRVVVQSPGFPALTSNTVVIKTNNESIGGNTSVLSATECTGNNVKVKVSNYTGAILGWEFSTDNATSWNTVALSNDSISKYILNQTVTTLYRANIKSGACPATVSDSVLVSTLPASVGGVVSNSATVCAGANSNTLNVTGNVGNVIRWESSTTGSSPWTSINQTTTSLVYNNITNSTYYRAVSKSGNCNEATSSAVLITVDNSSNGGFITGTQNVCSNLNTGVLNLNGNNGTIVQWEYSINYGTTWATTAINTSTYNFNNLTQSTLYKVQVANGICPAAYSNTFLVNVNPLPIVNFTFSAGCQGKSLPFTNTSAGSNAYSWDFKDGNGTTIINPSHNYSTAGNYMVKLTATSVNGCTDSIRKSVTVYPKPNVAFTSVDSICGFNQVTFTNNTNIASGFINTYNWVFGDNTNNSSATNPIHTYTIANNYTVKLVAVSNNSCSDSVTKQIEVFPKPNANFTTNNVCKKTAASFINTSYINGGGILYTWNFGDAQTSALTSPTHNYTLAGNYNVSLITNSNHGCKDTIIKPIYINEQPDLTIDVANVCLTKASVFTQTVTPSVSNYTLNWNFGNSSNTTGNSPNYTYLVAGNYQINASLTTDSNCVSNSTKITTVYPLPNVSFNFNNVCSADSALMNNLSSISSGSISYTWNFGNATTSALQTPKVLYSNAGTYTIQLIATSNYGCIDSLNKPITIFDSPVTNFTFSNVCDGAPVQFSNTSTVNSGAITITNWNFGDNSNSTLNNPSKQYLNFGSYAVTLQTGSSNGCTSANTQTLNVYEGAIANFSFTSQCVNNAVPFINLTMLSNGTYNSVWNFGDTATSALNSPNHLYQFAGTKEVWLKVTTNNGCVDSISKFVQAYAIPVVNAGKDTTIAKGFGVELNATGAASYAWIPATGLSNPTIANPIANPNETTTYIVQGTSATGCFSTDTVVVTIDESYLVIPYNIVTPNGNDKNDVWYIKNIESYPNNKVTVMDEWGVVIYEKQGYANTWNGRNTRGEILPDGTYYYILTFDGSTKIYKGFITLLRNK